MIVKFNTNGKEVRTFSPNHRQYKFANGYGASVINNGYGKESGLFEIAVLCNNNKRLDYSTPITDDVIGYLTKEEVEEILGKIEVLPKKGRNKSN